MADLFGYEPPAKPARGGFEHPELPPVTITADIDDPYRWSLLQEWDDALPLALWLMLNPSVAGRLVGGKVISDPTARRVVHFSRSLGCGSALIWNMHALQTPYPALLWKLLPLPAEVTERNLALMRAPPANAGPRIVAFGAEIGRRDRPHVERVLDAFAPGGEPLLCLGETADGWPLHPLARGKHAILNSTVPRPWLLSGAI